MTRLYCAIDAGQSHTECAIVDASGAVVARGHGGPSYAQDGSALLAVAFDDAFAALPLAARHNVRVVLLGATGFEIPGRRAALEALLRERFPAAALHVVSDAEFVLLSSVGRGSGGVLIAGTGCIAMGVWDDRRATVGGYGFLLGDEGGGVGIVLAALRRCLRLADSEAPLPPLAHELCAYFGASDIRRIPGLLYAQSPLDISRIAGAAPIVAAAAAHGDALAVELIEQCAHELAALAGRLSTALAVPPGARFPIYLSGGIWRMRAVLPAAFESALTPAVDWRLHTLDTSPATPAARYARELA